MVIALDVTGRSLEEVKNPYVEGICVDAHNSLSEGSVDCVLSISLLEHLENPEKCVKELYRVLKSTKTWWNSRYSAPKSPIFF